MAKIIGREEEIARIREDCGKNEASFIAVYGRRRIGKTYLIQNLAKEMREKD